MSTFGKESFRIEEGDLLTEPSTVCKKWVPGDGDLTFTQLTAPRFMTVLVSGDLKHDDWAGTPNTVVRPVIKGQIILFRPQKLYQTGSTAEVTLEY